MKFLAKILAAFKAFHAEAEAIVAAQEIEAIGKAWAVWAA